MRKLSAILILALSLVFWTACKKVNPISDGYQTTPYELKVPSTFPDLKYHPENPLTQEGVKLGRMLYYDSILDKYQSRACASCHEQSSSFTTYASNALVHVNLAWNPYYLWNGEIEGLLEDIMLFETKDFFQTDLENLNSNAKYRQLFKEAFGVEEISYKEVAFALAQFERTKISSNSRYDLYRKGIVQFTADEEAGLALFFSEKGDCFHCHATSLLTDNLFHNTGLDSLPDNGRMDVTNNIGDRGKFKTPTLRNIGLTAPYFHDGRFATLEEVIEFYSSGLKYSETIDPLMKNVHQGGVQLNDTEKAQLLAFLHTFTDTSFINNPALSNPFE